MDLGSVGFWVRAYAGLGFLEFVRSRVSGSTRAGLLAFGSRGLGKGCFGPKVFGFRGFLLFEIAICFLIRATQGFVSFFFFFGGGGGVLKQIVAQGLKIVASRVPCFRGSGLDHSGLHAWGLHVYSFSLGFPNPRCLCPIGQAHERRGLLPVALAG